MPSSLNSLTAGDTSSAERCDLVGLAGEHNRLNIRSESISELFPEIIGRSKSMLKTLEITAKVAQVSSNKSSVLILGESGTGKELVASAIHRLSHRAFKPFIALNCSAIPENLLEAELFGHEKGAFTGADKRRVGIFSRANGGTIFLDEIGDMPPRLQAKLLRVLQDKKFSAVGSNKLEFADVRIIAATNVDLDFAVKKGEFRLDLFYRLNVLPINLPPLRERGDDVRRLLEHFLVKESLDHQKPNHCYFSSDVIEVLKGYTWPGNVRELQNLVERLVVMKDNGAIGLSDLPQKYLNTNRLTSVGLDEIQISTNGLADQPRTISSSSNFEQTISALVLPSEGICLPSTIEKLENQLIIQALKITTNNKNKAAKLLGMNRTTLVERIKKRGLAVINSVQQEL